MTRYIKFIHFEVKSKLKRGAKQLSENLSLIEEKNTDENIHPYEQEDDDAIEEIESELIPLINDSLMIMVCIII